MTETVKLKDACSLKENCDKPIQCIKKQRQHFAEQGPYRQSYIIFPVVLYGCESWTIKRLSAEELMFLNCSARERRLLRVLWTARRSNQSILKEINHEYSLEGLMLKLKLQYFCNMMQRANSLEKSLMLGRLKAREEGDNQG